MMKTKNKTTVYKIDSCREKIKCLTNDVCNKPSYRTVCYKPIVDRSLLTHSNYLKMLSTPKGFKWIDMPLYYKKGYNKFHKPENQKYNIYGQQEMNYGKACNAQNKTIYNENQRKMNNTLNLNDNYKSKKLQNQRKKNDKTMSNNANKTKKNINTNKYGMGDDLKHKNESMIQKDEDSSSEKLRKLKAKQEADDLMKKKHKLWLKDEKKRIKREEEENKFKSSIQAKEKEKEEQKKNMEEKIKMELIRNEEQRKQKIENENEKKDIAQEIAKKKILEEYDLLSKEAERQRRLEALKEEEEEAWRKKINEEFALKLGYPMNSNIVKKRNEHSMCNNANNGNKRLPQYTDKLLKEIKHNNQVFDPGNLMKQIIKRELNKAENKKIKQNPMRLCEPCNKKIKNMIMIKTEEKKEKPDLPKKKVSINSKNSDRVNQLTGVKSNEHCKLNKHKKMLKCKILGARCYSNTSFNTLVYNWKNEVADMIKNMQKRRYNCTK